MPDRRKTLSYRDFANASGIQKLKEIIRAAFLGTDTGRAESSIRLSFHHGVCDLSVDVYVPVPQFFFLSSGYERGSLNTVRLHQSCPETETLLSDRGFRIHEINLSESIKAGGSAKCLTLQI